MLEKKALEGIAAYKYKAYVGVEKDTAVSRYIWCNGADLLLLLLSVLL